VQREAQAGDGATEGLVGSRPRLLAALAALAVVALSTALVFSPLFRGSLSGLGIDLLYMLRHETGIEPDLPESRSVILAIDEETYRRQPFEGIPSVMWTPQLATVFDGMLDAGVSVIGLDVVYPTSIEGFVWNGERPLARFDRPFLLTLRRGGAQEGRVVLGYVQHQEKPLFPHPGMERIVGGRDNIRSLNAYEDPDGIIRRLSLSFETADGGREPSFSLELAARAVGADPATAVSGPSPTLGGRPIDTDGGGNVLLNFDTRPGSIPIYSLADLHACAEQGNAAYFERHFRDKVVILGVVVDLEDRKFTSRRFATTPDGAGLPDRCVNPVMDEFYRRDLTRDQIPGVLLHATAVNNMITGTALRPLGLPGAAPLVALVSLLAAAAALVLPPARSFVAAVAMAAAWVVVAAWAFHAALVLPFLEAMAAASISYLLVLLFRIAVADRDKQQIRKAFSLYLPQALVDRMAATGQMPALGGETRRVSILFTDIAGFTKISEGVEPEELVAWLNRYFGAMTDIVEKHGGFVDKFIGDAILAVFGAPLDDPDHATKAVRAAMEMRDLLADPTGPLAGGVLGTPKNRIGVNSGATLIGNIGSQRRFNYTVIGDAVNLASRLEGANKAYGTQILVSQDTVELCDPAIRFRELDVVRVVGRNAPVALFEPVSDADWADPAQASLRQAFADGLAAWRAGRFEDAAGRFEALAHHDTVSAAFLKRSRAAAFQPAPDGWDGVTDLTEK
jgi:adenylate cyclase